MVAGFFEGYGGAGYGSRQPYGVCRVRQIHKARGGAGVPSGESDGDSHPTFAAALPSQPKHALHATGPVSNRPGDATPVGPRHPPASDNLSSVTHGANTGAQKGQRAWLLCRPAPGRRCAG